MNTDNMKDLVMMQLSDSLFPAGLFATSNGLEFLHNTKKISTYQEILDLIIIQITQQVAPLDGVLMLNAYEYAEKKNYLKLVEVDEILFSSKTIRETRESSTRSGAQLIKCMAHLDPDNEVLNWYLKSISDKTVYGTFPVSLGICCQVLNISKKRAMLMLLYGFTASMVGAALRLGMINHFEGQKIIYQTNLIIADVADKNIEKSISEIWQFAPLSEISQMSHEKMDSKMFIS